MTELNNSTRIRDQATYATIKVSKEEAWRNSESGRAVDKFALVSSLAISDKEVEELQHILSKKIKNVEGNDAKTLRNALGDLKVLRNIVAKKNLQHALGNMDSFANMKPENLLLIANTVAESREEKASHLIDQEQSLLIGVRDRILKTLNNNGQLHRRGKQDNLKANQKRTLGANDEKQVSISFPPSAPRIKVFDKALLERVKHQSTETRVSHSSMISTNPTIIALDLFVNDLRSRGKSGDADFIEETAQRLNLPLDSTTIENYLEVLNNEVDFSKSVSSALVNRLSTEPIGYLHLERLGFTPAGIERGELVYSIPLSPSEEVNISHKEWSNTSEEFQKIVTDYLEEYSEEGVVEKNELTNSTESQTQHSSALNTGVTASGSYGTVSISASASYNANNSESESRKDSQNHSSEMTRKASSRSKKEHKMSFKVASSRDPKVRVSEQ